MHKVGAIQPNFIPWRGYFDFIRQVDTFVILDDLQYTTRDWRNRNKVKLPQGGSGWLTVPVTAKRDTLICEAKINYETDWIRKHLAVLGQSYRDAPFHDPCLEMMRDVYETHHDVISDLDIDLTKRICDWLGITTKLVKSSDLQASGAKDHRLLQVTEKVGGTHYLSGPAAKAYIQPELWSGAGIELEYIDYPDYPAYPQVSEPYEPGLSILDLLFMTGPDAAKYIWDA